MRPLKCPSTKLLTFGILLYLCTTLIWHEFLIYYIYLGLFCRWPQLENASNELNALILSDTHLLGTIRGHWFDKLRREWQMYRSFQTAITLYSPDTVFVLGDIFDEGELASNTDFDQYVKRFHSIFYVPEDTKLYVVTGNHDVGFHYRTNIFLNRRFDQRMNTTTVDYLNPIDDIYFVRINSIAMENDGCTLCNDAINRIEKLSLLFEKKRKNRQKPIFPIILTHFPLFRLNEAVCTVEDSVPIEEKFVTHRPGIDCFSKETSEYLLNKLKPRLILNGHVHHSCHVNHKVQLDMNTTKVAEEWTVASFSWRNKVNPSFLLLKMTDTDHAIHKCFLINENAVICSYIVFIVALLMYILVFIYLRIKHKYD